MPSPCTAQQNFRLRSATGRTLSARSATSASSRRGYAAARVDQFERSYPRESHVQGWNTRHSRNWDAASLSTKTPRARGDAAANATRSGIYLSVGAFRRGDLALGIDCTTEQRKIDLHSFYSKSYIDVTHDGKSQRYQKREIFGYRDCEKRDVRFFNGEGFQLVESGPITIYTREERVPYSKAANARITADYFSTSPDAPIARLTRVGIDAAYPANHRFHDLLSSTLRGDAELASYDAQHKMHAVNHLYAQSQVK